MIVSPNVKILSDSATPALAEIMDRTRPERLANIVRQPLETFTRVHLRNNGTNKKGWPSTGFWEDASRATSATVNGSSVLIDIAKLGVRQRYFGGVISPVNAKALAIPISPVSYGHLPREFPGLFLLPTKKGAYLVQYGESLTDTKSGQRFVGAKRLGGNAGSRRAAQLNFLFKISGGVKQQPDPSVVPNEDEYTEVAFSAIERSLA